MFSKFQQPNDLLAVFMLETLKFSKTLKSSRDDFNVLENFNVSSIKTAINSLVKHGKYVHRETKIIFESRHLKKKQNNNNNNKTYKAAEPQREEIRSRYAWTSNYGHLSQAPP